MSEETKITPAQEIKVPPTVTVKRSMKDNKILVAFLSWVLYPVVFFSGLLAAASMTYEVIGMILPGQVYMQWLGITFYDFGALVWWLMYVTKARGTRQRLFSLCAFVVDFAGALLMIYADLNLGGQTLVTPPAWLGKWLINGTTIVMALNILLGYLYHMSSPEDLAAAADQDADDEIEEVTRAQQRAYLDANIHTLAAPMFARSVARFKMRNGLQLTDADYNALEGVIDGTIAAPQLPAGNQDTFLRAFGRTLVNFFVGGRRNTPSNSPSEMNTPSQWNPSNLEKIAQTSNALICWNETPEGRVRLWCKQCREENRPWILGEACEHVRTAKEEATITRAEAEATIKAFQQEVTV